MENRLAAIIAEVTLAVPIADVWTWWTAPADIKQWNSPSDGWQTLKVENDLHNEGRFLFRMEATDGSDSFDFTGKYDNILTHELIEYTLSDGRKSSIRFAGKENTTTITETFEPESTTPLPVQKEFCQQVLENFKRYAESQPTARPHGLNR